MNAASKTMKGMVRNIDLGVIEPVIETLYNTLMLDPSVPDDIKGDACVKARGSDSLMYKEAIAMRQQELLQLTGNQVDQQIFGTDERYEIYKQYLRNLDLPTDRTLPEKEELKARIQQQMMMQQQAAAQAMPANAK